MASRPFRFGISIAGAPSRRELLDTIKRAEDSGFDVICTADHISSRLAVIPLLATAFEVSGLRVSPMVIANDYHHPVYLARETATLDHLSEGRFELGIGTGWIREQYESAGIAYDPPGRRVDRFVESIAIIKGCWAGGPFSHPGKHYQIDRVTSPRPFQRPRPPILIAGSGRRMLTIAAHEADIVGISPLGRVAHGFEDFGLAMATSGSRIDDQIQWLRDAAAERFDQIELSVMAHHLELTNDLEHRVEELANEWGSTPQDVKSSPHVFLGTHDRISDVLQERRDRYGISYVVFPSSNLKDVEGIVATLAGA